MPAPHAVDPDTGRHDELVEEFVSCLQTYLLDRDGDSTSISLSVDLGRSGESAFSPVREDVEVLLSLGILKRTGPNALAVRSDVVSQALGSKSALVHTRSGTLGVGVTAGRPSTSVQRERPPATLPARSHRSTASAAGSVGPKCHLITSYCRSMFVSVNRTVTVAAFD